MAYTQVFLNAEVPNFDFPDLNSWLIKCGIKTTNKWQQITVNKSVTAIDPNNLYDWIIQERITVMIFVGEIEQKQAIWCLKLKSLN